MNSEIIQKIFNIKSSTVDDMKNLLTEIKSYKDEKLLQKIKQLENELKEVKKAKKYGLIWEEKQEFFDKETINKLPVLEEVKEKNIQNYPPDKGELKGVSKENNILIEGDNYHSLSVLNYTHKGKIDVIYIDPPYNTGNDFIYNDKIVDKEDKFRHSKWLSFMNKRLKLAKKLLSNEGVVFISIDDNELSQLKLLCNEIFLEENFIAQLSVVNNLKGNNNTPLFSDTQEYCLVYSRNKSLFKLGNLDVDEDNIEKWYEDEKGYWKLGRNIKGTGENAPREKRPTMYFPLYINEQELTFKLSGDETHSIELYPLTDGKEMCWNRSKNKFITDYDEIIITKNKDSFSVFKKQRPELGDNPSKKPKTTFYNPSYSNTVSSSLIKNIFGNSVFNYSKSIDLIKDLIKIGGVDKNSTILDFFAGSGTTGHAVLELNKDDGGNRKFILATNNENNICEEVTYERIKRVMTGYSNQKGEQVEGLGGNLTYLKTAFIDKTNVNDDLRVRMVARCSELLCLKENIWEEIKQKNDKIKIFKRHDKYLTILFDVFYFGEFIEVLKTLDKPVSIYTFCHYKLNKNDFNDLQISYEIEQIPDPILEVYESIFGL